MKTLANCSDIEFLQQTNKIRKAVQNWLDITGIMAIREHTPEEKTIPPNASEDERKRIIEENKKLRKEQAKKNLDEILDAVLEKYPEETVKVMKMCCFVDPDDTSKHIGHYMAAFSEMAKDDDVLNFFSSLGTVGKRLGLTL